MTWEKRTAGAPDRARRFALPAGGLRIAGVRPPLGTYLAGIGAGILGLAGVAFLALSDSGLPPALLAAAVLALGLGLGGALLRVRTLTAAGWAEVQRAETEVRNLRALVAASPDPWCAWSTGGAQAASPRFAEALAIPEARRLEDVETALDPSDAAALHGSFRHLQETGEPFLLTVRRADGERVFQLAGRRAGTGDGERFDLLWLRDMTATATDLARGVEARNRAEEECRRLSLALDTVPVPVWLRGTDLSIVWCNRAFARLLDADPRAVVDLGLELPGGALALPPRDLAMRARNGAHAETESRYLVVDGDRRLFRLTEMPLDRPDLQLGFGLDITGEQEIADELERHVSAHAEVLEQLGSAIAIFGADTRLRFYNRAYAQLWGLDEVWLDSEPGYGELLEDMRARRKLTEQVDFPRWKRQRLAQFTSLLEPEEEMVHLPDGRTLRTLTVPHPFGGLMFVQEDVTHTLALESSYNTLMAVQQETLDNLEEAVAVFGGDGRLKLHNPAFLRLWGLGEADLAGEPHIAALVERVRPLMDVGGDWAARRAELVAGLLDRMPRTSRMERVDGSVLTYSQVPLPDGAVLFSAMDVTDSVRVEQALRATNEALETADRLKSEFIANVSYQLRTPLNAIMGFAEILNNQYFGPLNPRQIEYARGVLEASRRLLALVNDILDLATIEAGFMVLERAPVEIAGLLNGVATLTRDWARQQELDLRTDIPAGIGTLEADEKRLKQALFNLVSNAVRFTPAGGRIVLSARREGDAVVLGVRDTGIGIPQDDQQRVFGRFERAHHQSRSGGAGLGLSLVKSIIELHGGRVEIESAPEHGTEVRCRLPTGPALAEPVAGSASAG